MVRLHQSLPLPSKVKQIDSLQMLRALAVSLVAWTHLCQAFSRVSTADIPSAGIFGIDIFFVISGFIMARIILESTSKPGLATSWTFLRRRLIRIYPIYWFYAILTAIRVGHTHTSVWPYVPSLLLPPVPQWPRIIDLGWTLMFEMFFYIVLSAILLITVRRAIPAIIGILCLLVGIGVWAHPRLSFWTVALNPILLEFVLGASIALNLRNVSNRKTYGIASLVMGTVSSLYLSMHRPSGAMSMQDILPMHGVFPRVATWGIAAALLVAGGILWPPTVTSIVGRWAVVIGNASYSAYLASMLVIEVVVRMLLKAYTTRPLPFSVSIAFVIIGLAAVLGVGWVSYQFLEWPMVRWLNKVIAHPQRE